MTEGAAHLYRLQKINDIQKEIALERDKRVALSTKYHRAAQVIGGIVSALVVSTMGLSVAGIIVAPIAIAMQSIALGTGLLSVVGTQVNKKLAMKAEKHERIKTLADAKLNTISGYISNALKDDLISDGEYLLILSELEKFNQLKEEIRSTVKRVIDEETKQSLTAKEGDGMAANFQSMLGKSG